MYVFSVEIPENKQEKDSTEVTKLKAKYEWCFSKLKCKKIGSADAIPS